MGLVDRPASCSLAPTADPASAADSLLRQGISAAWSQLHPLHGSAAVIKHSTPSLSGVVRNKSFRQKLLKIIKTES